MPTPKYQFDLQGHRGARGLRPENTLPAFLLALKLGVTTLELDTVISRDRKVVVSHDPWFNPLVSSIPNDAGQEERDPSSLRIYEMMYADIKKINVGARQHPLFPRQVPLPVYKPLLSEVIEYAELFCRETGRPAVAYNIETKSTLEGDDINHPGPAEFVDLLIHVLYESGISNRATIQSFDKRTLKHASGIDCGAKLSLLIDVADGDNLDRHFEALGFTPEILSPDYKMVTSEMIASARRGSFLILPWTVNDKDDMIQLLDMGVDGLITDYPDIGAELLSIAV